MDESKDINYILPFGQSLKPSIASSIISKAEMKKILAKRGIFVVGSESKHIIPMLSTIILSPSEFEHIIEKQKDKEDSVKIKSRTISCKPDFQLTDQLDDLLNFASLIDEYECNYEAIGSPNIEVISNEEFVIDYQILRKDRTKDFGQASSTHEAKVTIRKPKGNGQIDITMESTAVETKEVNERIVKQIVDKWKETGIVHDEAEIEQVMFEDFSNEERIRFLLSFHDNEGSNGTLDFQQIIHVELRIVSNATFPDHLLWLKDKVNYLSLDGKELHELELFKEHEYRKSLLVDIVEAEYKFKYREFQGTCKIEYGFPTVGRKKDKNPEFEIRISGIKFPERKRNREISKKVIERELIKVFDNMKKIKYEKGKNSSTKTSE